eukprot:GHVR01085259.1.p1 GENE.GHVR01085259.1~~GHVR01085259.1.p1  ORF type:complete len:390 (+),score=100.49 GHVR01085259.1:111-1172(+)
MFYSITSFRDATVMVRVWTSSRGASALGDIFILFIGTMFASSLILVVSIVACVFIVFIGVMLPQVYIRRRFLGLILCYSSFILRQLCSAASHTPIVLSACFRDFYFNCLRPHLSLELVWLFLSPIALYDNNTQTHTYTHTYTHTHTQHLKVLDLSIFAIILTVAFQHAVGGFIVSLLCRIQRLLLSPFSDSVITNYSSRSLFLSIVTTDTIRKGWAFDDDKYINIKIRCYLISICINILLLFFIIGIPILFISIVTNFKLTMKSNISYNTSNSWVLALFFFVELPLVQLLAVFLSTRHTLIPQYIINYCYSILTWVVGKLARLWGVVPSIGPSDENIHNTHTQNTDGRDTIQS